MRMGVDPYDLLHPSSNQPAAPTFTAYIPIVAGAVSDSTRRSYSPYWRRLEALWGHRALDEPAPSEIEQLAEHVRSNAIERRNSRAGRSAAENFIAAIRCLYRHAENDRLIKDADNPARKVAKPRRRPSTRRALTDTSLAEITYVAAATGNDPELDALILRLHVETACRRGGALSLRSRDLDAVQSLIYLREKDGNVRWQPVSPTLMAHLLRHADRRGATEPDEKLLRYRSGKPITYRRYDHLWERIGQHLPWVHTQQISTHWLRHTTLTWVERNFGYAVAHAYAGHHDSSDSATTTYVKASIHDIATALAALTGEPHPLATDAHIARPDGNC
ncbi:tyrosine-type recombinase/integrase [Amycolatopsis aidingensis]|uniref:tyrosine-type recombinase/integrase n=1 Tax=Amycolatopsis aidingensis TaxID=2842453 RepID=UPI001C0DED15